MLDADLLTLRLLVLIADKGSVTAAAETLNMTPSAASQRITKFEGYLGLPLLERLPRGVRMTEAGAVVVQHARGMIRSLHAAAGQLGAMKAMESGVVRLGSFPTISASLLSDALKDAHARWPGIEVVVRSALRPRLIEMLTSGEIELALLWSYPWTPITEPLIELSPLGVDTTVLLVAADSPLQDGVGLWEVTDARWIIRNGDHPASALLDRSFSAFNAKPNVVYEAYDYQEIQAMVGAGMGIAMAPRLALTHHRPDVRVVELAPSPSLPERSIYLARLNRREPSPSMRGVMTALRDAAQQLRVL